jgi:hypothetical protein
MRFKTEHPGAIGGYLANFYWHYSWVGIIVSGILSCLLVWLRFKKSLFVAEVVYYFGIWMLVVWCGIALVAMEQPFVPWLDLRGAHF